MKVEAILTVLVLIFLLAFLYESYLVAELKISTDYFKAQTSSICDLSNSYRNLTLVLMNNSEYKSMIPPKLNCTKILLNDK